eukprot:s1353_g4.t1
MEVEPTDRERQNWEALGGMRNPHLSVGRLPHMARRGQAVRAFLRKALHLWPKLKELARAILQQEQPSELPEELINKLRHTLLNTLWDTKPRPPRTARAQTPIHSAVVAGWKEDPDASTLARWLDEGAPMGFSVEVQPNGIFPQVPSSKAEMEFEQVQAKTLEGWTNYESAQQEQEELRALIRGYIDRGFCHLVDSLEEAEKELGRAPIVNKLGLIMKFKETETGEKIKKARIIWDLRRSGANATCRQSERILLPRLLDVAAHALSQYRAGKQVWMAAVDIKDAFLNVPVTEDRFALTAALPSDDPETECQILIFDTLVFGAASAPTVWGRFAAFLGRTIAAIEPSVGCQVYVDDLLFTLRQNASDPRPYGRGSAGEAMAHMADPANCLAVLKKDISASTTVGPTASRRKLWAGLATKSGALDPFELDPPLMFKVMGALKLAGFRSAQLYLDSAKSAHIAAGHPWHAQLQQAYRAGAQLQPRFGHPKAGRTSASSQARAVLGVRTRS